MSLHDISKSGSYRIRKPAPNSKDTIPPDMRMAHDTAQINYSIEGQTSSEYGVKMVKGKIEVKDASNNTIGRLGFDSTDADQKIKVAKPGQTL